MRVRRRPVASGLVLGRRDLYGFRMALDVPDFAQPDFDATRLRVERAAVAFEAGRRARRAQAPQTAAGRWAALGIDAQVTFCHPDGGLFVPGAPDDVARTTGWLYRHTDRLDALFFSLDTHRTHQIFHPAWWRDANGEPPPPMTVIHAKDIASGKWVPRRDRELALEYAEKLEATGRYVLTIWPYHGFLGGVSHALMPSLMEAATFHAGYHDRSPSMVTKGGHEMSEHFSIFRPEVEELGGKPVEGFNEELLRRLLEFDRVYVFGQAKSHCVLSSLRDLKERLEGDRPEALKKFHLLEDCMSPVTPPPLDPLPDALNFPAIAERAFDDFEAAGMVRTRSDQPLD